MRSLLLAAGLLSALLLVGCGGVAPCGAGNCAGCCDSKGVCQLGLESGACGEKGQACQTCGGSCESGVCSGGLGGDAGTCSAGLTACGSTCADTTRDPAHCGSCGQVCSSGQACSQGACVSLPSNCQQSPCPGGFYCDLSDSQCKPGCAADSQCQTNATCDLATHQCTCGSGFHACASECVSNTSPQSCGSSCSPCPGSANGSATCDGTTCGLSCAPGFLSCGGSCIACADPHGSAACVSGACQITCQSGYHGCGNQCFADTDPSHCGAQCAQCPAPTGSNMSAVCTNQQCGVSCNPGYSVCKGSCQQGGTCKWSVVPLTTTTAEGEVAVDVDSSDQFHVAYLDGTTMDYARFTPGSTPTPEAVNIDYGCGSPLGQYGGFADFAISAVSTSAKARIACMAHDFQNQNNLEVADWNGTAWVSTVVQNTGTQPGAEIYSISMAQDRIAWTDWYTQYNTPGFETVYYSELAGGAWSTAQVDFLEQNGSRAYLLGAAPNAPAVGYLDFANTSVVMLGTESAGVWSPAPLSGAQPAQWGNVLRSDPSGSLGQVYASGTNAVSLTYRDQAGGWQDEPISPDAGYVVDFAFDASAVPHVAYGSNSGIHYATRINGRWFDEVVTPDSADTISLAIRPGGTPLIGYGKASVKAAVAY